MGEGSDCWPAEPQAERTGRHRRYLEYLVVFLALGVLGLLALLYALNASGPLPASSAALRLSGSLALNRISGCRLPSPA